RLRILGVHLKSGCSEGPITNPSSDEDCPALALQLPYLKAWIVEAAAKPESFAVIGDFNRRLDRESADILDTDMWDLISGAATAGHDDDVLLDHIPKAREFKCWPDDPAVLRFSIDFFVLDARALALADPAS